MTYIERYGYRVKVVERTALREVDYGTDARL
jgi:hypothetical protein